MGFPIRNFVFVGAALMAGAASASVTVQLTPSVSTAPVGATVTWTATASDSANPSATFTYQFSVGPSVASLQVRRDFSNINQYPWTPADSEGVYEIQVAVREGSQTTNAGLAQQPFVVTSRVSGTTPVVSTTNHPLVALFSMPPCPSGAMAQVHYKRTAGTYWYVTPLKACNGTTSVNFYIGGLRASTEYDLHGHVYSGSSDLSGPVVNFTSGAIPSGLGLESFTMTTPEVNTPYPVLLTSPTAGVPFATDRKSVV